MDAVMDLVFDLLEVGDQAGADAAWLFAYDPSNDISDKAGVALMNAVTSEEVEPSLQERLTEQVSQTLWDALHDPAVLDERKFLLSGMFHICGGEIPPEEFKTLFHDFDAATRLHRQKFEATLSDDAEVVERTLAGLNVSIQEVEPPTPRGIEHARAVCTSLSPKNPAASAAMVCTLATVSCQYQFPPEPMIESLEALGQNPHERAAWYLQELSHWPATGPVGSKAGAVAEIMKAGGVQPRCPINREFSHGYFSMIDGAGSRNVTLFFRTLEGGMDGVVLMLNDQVGMKDAWCAFGDSTEIEEAIHRQEADLAYAPCTLPLARELVADVWAIHERDQRPLPGRFFAYRSYLGESPILPKSHAPNLGAYMLELMLPSPELVRGSDVLTEYGPYGGLYFTSDAAYQLVQAHKRSRKKELVDLFFREIVPQEMPLLLSRMAANLEMEAVAGRATQSVNQTAAKTYLALRDDHCKPSETPYVKEMVNESIARIRRNLSQGFTSQQQADQSGMDFDQQMSKLLEGLMGQMGKDL